MLCLSRTVCVWSNEIVPALVARRTQKRLRPTIGFIAEDVPWRPMMVFGAIGAAHPALVARMPWFHFTRLNTGSQDNLLWNVVCGAVSAVARVEVLNRTALVFALYNLPRLIPSALRAWVVWPFKGLCSHEAVPFLR